MGIGEIILVSLIMILIFMTLYVRYREKKEFNNGVCISCGSNLRVFDNDSQGGTGWTCENHKCRNYLWTSWVKVPKKKDL